MSSPEATPREPHPRQGTIRPALHPSLFIPIVITPYPHCRCLLIRSFNACSTDIAGRRESP